MNYEYREKKVANETKTVGLLKGKESFEDQMIVCPLSSPPLFLTG